jgi:hypothetical protein
MRTIYKSEKSFYQVVSEAVSDIIAHGYDSPDRVRTWVEKIKEAAARSLVPEAVVEFQLRSALRAAYTRLVENEKILQAHPGVPSFTLRRVSPRLHAELERRIMSSADLIKLNRVKAIQTTIERFSAWSTSVPAGGVKERQNLDRNYVKNNIARSIGSLPYAERRVAIDQGHKFSANLSDILSQDAGAVAARWNSHFRQAGYNYREDHRERDGQVYAVRGNWALEQGLMKPAGHDYIDEIELPGEFVYCRCWYTYIYSLRDLPPEMLTEKGKAKLAELRHAD